MVSNYEQITEANIGKYGTEIDNYGPVLLTQLYSERTHFIYELLQNAEDAEATKVRFKLSKDCFEVYHNGRVFNEADIKGICSIVSSTKVNDSTKIGKFGIGFKSVYAYTSSPEIHSGDEHFVIEKFVRPKAVPIQEILHHEYTTYFIIKFNLDNLPKENAFQEIKTHLKQFNPHNLIFLNNIEEISWYLENERQEVFKRELVENNNDYKKVVINVNSLSENRQDYWLIFGKSIPNYSPRKVEVAFSLIEDKKTGQLKIDAVPHSHSQLVVVFPTEKETRLNFLIQGPYLTTTDRAKIKVEDPFNRQLIELTADLVAFIIPTLKNLGLLTVNCLQYFPIRKDDFPVDSFFYPVFEKVRETLKRNTLLPSAEGDYITAHQAKLTRNTAFRKLFSDTQLYQLFGSNHRWLSHEISENRPPALFRYLKEQLEVEIIEPERLAIQFNQNFIEKQSDQWVAEFYQFLKNQEGLWKVDINRKNPPLLNKPFIRLANNEHVTPFKYNTREPNAYLPPENQTNFPTVKREIAMISEVKEFLKNLGLKEPSIFTEVNEIIISNYGLEKQIDENQNLNDIKKIIDVLQSSPSRERNQLIEKLKNTKFLRAINANTNEKKYQAPSKLYFRSDRLEMYFKGNAEAWFLDEKIIFEKELLIELGVSKVVRYYSFGGESHISISKSTGNYIRGIEFDPNFSIEGLAHALENPTYDKSVYIWNEILIPNLKHLKGEVEESSSKTFKSPKKSSIFSEAGRIANSKYWLPKSKSEMYFQPRNLSIDDLSFDFTKNKDYQNLASLLQIKPSAQLINQAKLIGIDPELVSRLSNAPADLQKDILKQLNEKLLKSSEQSNEFSKKITNNGGLLESEIPAIKYREALKEVFSRTGKIQLNETIEQYPVADPQKRMEKIQAIITSEKKKEPPSGERFKRIESIKWEAKDNNARTNLQLIYGGKCQICSVTFPKRNGEPYFEGVYLVSSTRARWIDQVGNVLCLCPTCCAKFRHGSIELEKDIEDQIDALPLSGGVLHIELCGENKQINFAEKHVIELKALLKAAED